MYEKISKKDLISANLEFDKGRIINDGSLDFALDEANRSKSWIRSCAVLVRAIIIDHVFEEGNKRTAAKVIMGFFDEHNIQYNPEMIAKAVAKILEKNITSMIKTEKVILDAVIR